MNRWDSDSAIAFEMKNSHSFRILAVTEGEVQISDDPSNQPLGKGQTVLLPACLASTIVTPNGKAEVLEIYVQ